jgi:hypothetical protein
LKVWHGADVVSEKLAIPINAPLDSSNTELLAVKPVLNAS